MSTASQSVPPPRVPTGVPGLDAILGTGLFKAGVYIVMGRPGTGKTLLGNQIGFHHVASAGRVVYVTLLSETHGRLLAFLQSMTFFKADAVGGEIAYLNGYTDTERDGLAGLMKLVRSAVRERAASLLIIDGMVTASTVAPTDTAYKKFIQELQSWVELIGCTVILLTSAAGDAEVRPEQTMVDGVLQLETRAVGSRRVRQLHVTKFRGGAFLEGQHTYEITDNGLVVYPRIEAALAGVEPVDFGPERAGFGVAGLDEMIGGGLMRGSTTLVIGGTGSGKSMLGNHFLKAGLAAGEATAAFGFYANPPSLIRAADERGFGFGEAVRAGKLYVEWQPSAERLLDKLGWQLIDLVRRSGASRLLVDGIEAFRETEDRERMTGFFAVLSQELRRLRVTALFTAETEDPFTRDALLPVHRLSAVSQNIIHMRAIERDGRLERQLWILKTRDRAHAPGGARFEILADGLRIAERSALTSSGTHVPEGG